MMNLLAQISGQSLINAVIWLIVAGLIWWLLNWAIASLDLGEPITKIARAFLILFVVIVCINALLGLTGHGYIIKW